MIVYLITFSIVIALTFCAQRLRGKSNRSSIIISLFCIIILSLLAAFRDYSVGTDVMVYGVRYFTRSEDFSNLLDYLTYRGNEQLYYALNYLLFRLTGNVRVLFFIIEFFVTSIVYYIGYSDKNKNSLWLYVFSYLMLWYCSTFNIMRQSIAMFIVLFAYRYLEERKTLKYIIFVFVASLFHTSALVCLIIPLFIFLSERKLKWLYYAALFMLIPALYLVMEPLLNLLNKVSFLNPIISQYMYFLDFEVTGFNTKFLLIKIVIAVGVFIFYFCSRSRELTSNFMLVMMMFLDIFLYCAVLFVRYGYRLSYYFLVFLILLIPRIDNNLRVYKNMLTIPGKSLYRAFIVISLLAYWIIRYYIAEYDGIANYMLFWQ